MASKLFIHLWGFVRESEVTLTSSVVLVVEFTDLFAPWSSWHATFRAYSLKSQVQHRDRCFPSRMPVHWKVCVPTAVSAGGGVRQTTICTDCSASLVQPTWFLQADLKGKWQWRGERKRKWDKEKKKLKRKAVPAVKADSLCTRIFTQELCLDGS